MIIKKHHQFETIVKQEPIDRVRYKGITASLFFSHERLEIIHYSLKKDSKFFLTPDESNTLPEVIYVISGVIKKELEHIKDHQTVKYQEGEFLTFDPVTKPVLLTCESEEAGLLYIYPAQVFKHLVAETANDLHNMVSSIEFKMGRDLERIPRIRDRAVEISKLMGLSEFQIYLIRNACHLSNIGKIMYTDELLNDERLQELESEHWRRHPIYAKEILQETEKPDFIKTGFIVEQCFEFWDGSGYPYGLKGNDISIEASIISLSLHYEDALEQFENEKAAIEFIKQGSGTLFRPDVVTAFIYMRDRQDS